MSRRRISSLNRLRYGFRANSLLILVVVLSLCCLPLSAQADGLNKRSLQLLSSAPGVTTDYTFSFTIGTSSTIGSLGILFCSNDPVQYDPCTAPVGLDVTNAQLISQSGIYDFSLSILASNSILLSRPAPTLITPPLSVTIVLHNVINPSAAGPYYARVSAYSSTDGTGGTVDYGGLAFAIVNNLQISSIVPPYLTFCSGLVIDNLDCASASGNYINFGEFSPTHSSQSTSQFLVATNAPDGYVVQVYGTTMTSGNNIINAITNTANSQPGTPQFGINLRANTIPTVGNEPTGPGSGQPVGSYDSPNHYQFISNDVIADSLVADDYRKYTVSYIVNVANSQPPGDYVSTLTYVCAGSF
jgi:hypothetical protein